MYEFDSSLFLSPSNWCVHCVCVHRCDAAILPPPAPLLPFHPPCQPAQSVQAAVPSIGCSQSTEIIFFFKKRFTFNILELPRAVLTCSKCTQIQHSGLYNTHLCTQP